MQGGRLDLDAVQHGARGLSRLTTCVFARVMNGYVRVVNGCACSKSVLRAVYVHVRACSECVCVCSECECACS
jgi:hypothetical protein